MHTNGFWTRGAALRSELQLYWLCARTRSNATVRTGDLRAIVFRRSPRQRYPESAIAFLTFLHIIQYAHERHFVANCLEKLKSRKSWMMKDLDLEWSWWKFWHKYLSHMFLRLKLFWYFYSQLVNKFYAYSKVIKKMFIIFPKIIKNVKHILSVSIIDVLNNDIYF